VIETDAESGSSSSEYVGESTPEESELTEEAYTMSD
jgi:hypothetical protein